MFRVNVVSGELCLFITEVFLPGLVPVDFSRSYQSTVTRKSCFGPGWSHPYELSLGQEGDELVLRKAGKPLHRFSGAAEDNGPYHLVPAPDSWWRVTEAATSTSYLFSRSKGEMPVSAIEDIHGNRLDFRYDAQARLVEILDPFKRRCALSYDGPLLTRIALVSHDNEAVGTMLLRCAYDHEGRLTKTVDANGSSRHFEYDGVRLVSYTNPLGGSYCAQFDELGRCIRHWTKGSSFSRTFAYDTKDRRTRVLDAAGHVWMFRFAETGLVTEQTDPMGGVVRFAYDSAGALISVDDPAGNPVFSFGSDSDGGTTVEMVSPGITHIIKGGEAGESVAIIDKSGQRWEIEENVTGNVTRYKSPGGHVWCMEYDRRGTLVRRVDPDGAATSRSVSEDGRQEKYADAIGPLVTTETDSRGRPVRYTRGDAMLSITYGQHQRTMTNDDGSAQVLEQNAVGLPVRYRDEIGAEWRYAWSPHGLLLSIADPLGHQVSFSYDAEGRPVSLINERGERFENTLDPLGRIIRQTEFNGAVSRFEYNQAGDLVGLRSADGARVSLDPDQGVELHLASGITRKRVVDSSGRLVSADEPEGVLELDYDPEGRLARESFDGAEVLYEYGWHPFPLSVKHGNREIRYGYDSRVRLVSAEETGGPAVTVAHADDRRTVIRFANGLSINRVADTMNRLVRQEVRSSTGREILAYDYRYDKATNLIARRRTSRDELAFGYTRREELATVQRGGQPIAHYEYDSAGNRSQALSGRSSYGAGGVLLTSPHGRYEHDEVGRPTRLEGPFGGTTYSYDDLGRLGRVGLPEGGSVEFSYDALYRRRTKTTLTGVRRTVWAGDVPLEEALPHGGSIKYLYDPVTEAPLAVEIGGEWHYVVRDGHGDITDVIRARDETVVWSAEPLGFETGIVIDDLPEPFPLRGFGQLFDPETGLVYQRARYYAPHEGRFLTPDPIGPVGGPNPYSYCLNQPLLWVDPLGLNPCLSRDECDRIRDRIQMQSAEVSARWNEMRYPKQILPFSGLTRAQGRRVAGKAVAPGAQGAPSFGTKGTVESHMPPYDQAQQSLNEAFEEYDRGQCHKHETKGDRKKVRRAREFRNKRPELHPDYGKKGPLPSSLQGRVTIAKG